MHLHFFDHLIKYDTRSSLWIVRALHHEGIDFLIFYPGAEMVHVPHKVMLRVIFPEAVRVAFNPLFPLHPGMIAVMQEDFNCATASALQRRHLD